MEAWRRRVNEALDGLLAATAAESCLHEQLEKRHVHGAAQDAKTLRLPCRESCDAARAARGRVEAMPWE
jgi:uncharacterized protein YaiL (DUF2058 family)